MIKMTNQKIKAIHPYQMMSCFVGNKYDNTKSIVGKILNESDEYEDHSERFYTVYDTFGNKLISFDNIPVAVEYFID